jgi:hypothetical protein
MGIVGLSDGLKNQDREQHVAEPSAPDEPTIKRTQVVVHLIALKKLTIRFWRGTFQHLMNIRSKQSGVGASVGTIVSDDLNG